jgi:CheY-like chemotaxis protein
VDKRARKRIPSRVETELLTLSRRRCCLCFFLERDSSPKTDGQIAHVNRDRTNNDGENLVYLCLRHHDMYDTIRSQSKNLTIAEIKHYREELYKTLGTLNPQPTFGVVVKVSQVVLSNRIRQDCAALNVSERDVVSFIRQEAGRHPLLFANPFSSLPLVFGENVLLVSTDSVQVRAERLLKREEAYPLHDDWNDCLAAYRRATLLGYRQRGPDILISEVEMRRSVATFHRLVEVAKAYRAALRNHKQIRSSEYLDIDNLQEEVEMAFEVGDRGAAVARMEILLSTIHKLILEHAPQLAPSIDNDKRTPPPTPTAPTLRVTHDVEISSTHPTILLVDDDFWWLEALSENLEASGFVVARASSTRDALAAMVERDFDLVITDLVMCAEPGDLPDADGREIILTAKKSSEKTKVIVVTGYAVMSKAADLIRAGADDIVLKTEPFSELEERINNLIYPSFGSKGR